MQNLHIPADFAYHILVPAIVAGFVSLLVYLVTNEFFPRIRRFRLTQEIHIVSDPPHYGNVRFRVVNNGHWTIHDAVLYLELIITADDTLEPAFGYSAWITPKNFVPLSHEQLCWSVLPNPMKVSIFAKEKQPFSPCKIQPDKIVIPTETGWPTPDTTEPGVRARVFLKRHKYQGSITLVSDDTYARHFKLSIDPDSTAAPCTITPL
jgi:hypothetical protein